MKEVSRRNYQDRIRYLEQEVADLMRYKCVTMEIFDAVVKAISEGKQISSAWIMDRFRKLLI